MRGQDRHLQVTELGEPIALSENPSKASREGSRYSGAQRPDRAIRGQFAQLNSLTLSSNKKPSGYADPNHYDDPALHLTSFARGVAFGGLAILALWRRQRELKDGSVRFIRGCP